MTEHGNPENAGTTRTSADNSKPGIKSAFAGLKSTVTNTVEAGKVFGRLAPKQLKDEVQIAKLELKTKGIALGKGAAVVAVGLVFALFLIIALISAAVLGLGKVMEPWLAALVLALVFLIFFAIFAFVGYKMIKKQLPLTPESAIFGVLYDLGVLKHGSEMTSKRLKREQAEKAAAKEEAKRKAAEEAKAANEGQEVPAPLTEEQLKERTKQRREHLKTLRDDLQNYTTDVQTQAKGLVGNAKTSVKNAPSAAASGSRQLGRNALDSETLKARAGSFAALAASLSAFVVFLTKFFSRKK